MGVIRVVTIPTVPSRRALLDEQRKQLASVPWVGKVIESEHTDIREDWARAMQAGFEASAGDDWFMLMEDDVYLGPRFSEVPEILQRATDTYGGGVGLVSFFQFRDGRTAGLHEMTKTWQTWGNQAVAIAPWAMPKDIFAWARQWRETQGSKHPMNAFDIALHDMVEATGAARLAYSPSLVQHRQVGSTTKGATGLGGVRQSPTYRATFGEVPGEVELPRYAPIPEASGVSPKARMAEDRARRLELTRGVTVGAFAASLGVSSPWPDEVPTTDTDNHGWFLPENRRGLSNVVSMESGIAIELGAWLGKSTRFLVDAGWFVVSVDTWDGKPYERDVLAAQSVADKRPQMWETFLANQWTRRGRVLPLRMLTDEAAQLPFPKVGLVYVDACHEYEAVMSDLRNYLPFLAGDGVMCGDDWRWKEVRRAVETFAHEAKLDIEQTGNYWRYHRRA